MDQDLRLKMLASHAWCFLQRIGLRVSLSCIASASNVLADALSRWDEADKRVVFLAHVAQLEARGLRAYRVRVPADWRLGCDCRASGRVADEGASEGGMGRPHVGVAAKVGGLQRGARRAPVA